MRKLRSSPSLLLLVSTLASFSLLGACSDAADATEEEDDGTPSGSSGSRKTDAGGSNGSSSSSGGRGGSSSGGIGTSSGESSSGESSSGESSSGGSSSGEPLFEPAPGTPCPEVGQQFERRCNECGIAVAYCMQSNVVSGYGACREPSVCPEESSSSSSGGTDAGGSSSSSGGADAGSDAGGSSSSSSGGADAGPDGGAPCTVITPEEDYWGNAFLCGPNGDQMCRTVYDTRFTPAIDGKASNWLTLGYNATMQVGTTVNFAYEDYSNVILYSQSFNAGDTAATAAIFEAESGTFTLHDNDLDDGDVDATLTNVKLVESVWDEEGNPTRVPGGRCLLIPSAEVFVINWW